jgi:uncharacterized protein with PIN domain
MPPENLKVNRVPAGDRRPVRRPQHLEPARFVLDVHLGTLARRLRLVGVDTAYANDADDDALVEQANASRRVLLTQDRDLADAGRRNANLRFAVKTVPGCVL